MKIIKTILLSYLISLFFLACAGDQSLISQSTSSASNGSATTEEANNNNNDNNPENQEPNNNNDPEKEEPQVEVKYNSIDKKSNEIATVTCEEVYEFDAEKNIKYSLFADFYGDYLSGSSILCSLQLNEGYEKSKLSNVRWTFLGDKVFDNPKYSENIFIHVTDKKRINPPVERCIDSVTYYFRLSGSKVTFTYDGSNNEIALANKTLSKLEGRKFEHLPLPPKQDTPAEESIPSYVDDPLDCSKPRNLYADGMLDIGKAPSSTQNGGANLPLVGYNYGGTTPFESSKTYAFIRVKGDSTKADYICKQQFSKEYACPRDIRLQICNGTGSECYFTFRSDYMMKDTNYNIFHSNVSGACRVQIPLTDSINYAENTGFQYDGGKKMNFPFYIGDPSLVLNSTNSIKFVSFSVDNLDGKFSLLGGQPNFARKSGVEFKANISNKGDNNIALFTIIWGTYNGQYNYQYTFDGWAKLPSSVTW